MASAATTPAAHAVPRKKLTSYVGFANLPNQVHRSCVRKGFTFTAMVVGAYDRPTELTQVRRVSASRRS